MFNKVFVEKDILHSDKAQSILDQIKYKQLIEINQYTDIWGKTKKPYLQKRTDLNLFIAHKKGQLIKEAPQAYGHGREKHYYYIHAYNCIYECEYCYLQGYFKTPDIVFFINHEEIIQQMQNLAKADPNCWFHAGEFSDSLALSHITSELPEYFDFFAKHPECKLELRTKSVNIRPLLEIDPLKNIYVSFTLSSDNAGKSFDIKCPSVKHRLNAIEKLVKHGYMIGIHFDPIIYHDHFEQAYQDLIAKLSAILPDEQLGYISIGVVRFTHDVYYEVKQNYPDSIITKQDYIKSFDNKLRYNRPMRMWMMNKVKSMLINHYTQDKIYLCMEEDN